jgi:hypothetical protein
MVLFYVGAGKRCVCRDDFDSHRVGKLGMKFRKYLYFIIDSAENRRPSLRAYTIYL